MVWDKSDSDIEEKFTQITTQRESLEKKLMELRTLQKCVISLRLIENTVTIEDGIRKTTYNSPKDQAGNQMDSDYRDEQKKLLIINIDKFLGNNDV